MFKSRCLRHFMHQIEGNQWTLFTSSSWHNDTTTFHFQFLRGLGWKVVKMLLRILPFSQTIITDCRLHWPQCSSRPSSPTSWSGAWSGRRCPAGGSPGPGPEIGKFPSASCRIRQLGPGSQRRSPGSPRERGPGSWRDWLQQRSSVERRLSSGTISCWSATSWRWSWWCFDINGAGVLTRRSGCLRLSHQEARLYSGEPRTGQESPGRPPTSLAASHPDHGKNQGHELLRTNTF